MIRYAYIFLCCFVAYLPLNATVVIDSETGKPLIKASVFDRKGNVIGVCDDSGEVPYVDNSSYPLTVSYIGYSDARIPNRSTERVFLKKISYNLPEVVVESKKREVLHLTGYLREYSTLSNYTDTVFLFREKTIDFMVPTKKARGYKGWLTPRLLASRSFYRFTDSFGNDSVSNHFRRHFSWSDWFGIFNNIELPLKFRDAKIATDTVYGRYSPSLIWRKNDDRMTVDVDIMADSNNSKWVPGVFELFSRQVEFTRFNIKYLFTGVDGNGLFADNIARIAFNVESNGRSSSFTKVPGFADNGPSYVNTYAEIYITDIEYMSVHDAVKCEKNPPPAEDIGIRPPKDAPELQPAVYALVERVNNFDYIGHRLIEKADERLAGKEIPDKYRKPDNIFQKVIHTIIQSDVWPKEGMQGRFRLGR